MPNIDWLKAGSAAENSASSIVNDFRGRILCDSEILGEAEGVEGVTKEEFIAFTRTAIHNDLFKLDSGMWTRTDPVVKSNQQFVDGCYSYSATVIAFKTDAGDRIEHWEGGTNDDGEESDGMCCLLQTSSGFLIVGCAIGHPFVCCNLFDFGNSDGSTDTLKMDTSSGQALTRSLIDTATTYCYSQEH